MEKMLWSIAVSLFIVVAILIIINTMRPAVYYSPPVVDDSNYVFEKSKYNIVQLSNGNILLTFKEKEAYYYKVSKDGMNTWGEPVKLERK